MVLQCIVKGCETVGNDGFHRFPTNKLAAEKWILATKAFHLLERLKSNKLSNSFYKICRKHFLQTDLVENGKGQVIVKQDSTPSLFLPTDVDIPYDINQIQLSLSKPKPVKRLQHQHLPTGKNCTKLSEKENDLEENDSEIDVEGVSSEEEIDLHGKNGRKRTNQPKVMKVMNESRRSNQLSYYKRRTKVLQEKVKSNKLTDATVLSYLKTKFNEQLLEFVKMQLKNCGRSKHGRRYSLHQKSLCLAMYKKGPKSYRFNETWCCLPTKRTLGRYSARLIFQSGVDYKVLAAMKNIVTDWPHKDKFCTFGWDEVSLNAHLDYCQSLDKIEGFVEMGRPNKPIFATHALTFMLRGIEVPFKQSIGYFYTNGLKSFELAELIKLMIGRVQIIGLMPILSVCDTYSTNATTVNTLVYPNTHQTKQSGDLLQYKINGQLITHTYDPSHLIKVVRNNLQTKNLAHFVTERWTPGLKEFDEELQIATWDDIDKLYRKDVLSSERLAEKLSAEHLKPSKLKMKVSIAAQVFSNTCGLAMMQYVEHGTLPKDIVSTANFVFFMNDLFDSINGSNNQSADSLKSSVTPNSLHFEFWEYALIMLENMFYVDKIDGERNDRSSVLKKFESTIRGYQEVAKTCFKANIPKVNIRDTTQDGLENFFGCVKSCNYSNTTTASQYRTGYTTMVINNITGTNSLYSNCQPDDSESILTNIHEFISVCQEQPHDPVYVSYPEPKPFSCVNENLIVESESETDEFESIISFDPEVEDDHTSSIVPYNQSEADDTIDQHHQFLETNSNLPQVKVISSQTRRICQKIFKTTSCEECKENFELMDNDATLLSVEKLLGTLNKSIADICYHEGIKKKLLHGIEEMTVHVIGCPEHIDTLERKVKILAVDQVVLSFCNNINKILSKKITTLPDKPNLIERLAFEHRKKKKGIGKFSDKFNQ